MATRAAVLPSDAARASRVHNRIILRILAINQFYAPDHAATSQLLTELCEDLAAAGDEVSVVASRGQYLGGGRALPAKEEIQKVHVLRPWTTSLGKRTIAHRLVDYGSFWTTSTFTALRAERPDVILALTTPPLIAAGAALAALGRRTPLVLWVQDVYPDLAVRFGVLRENSPCTRAFRLMQRTVYRRARTIVALSDGMRDRLIAQGAPPLRIRVVPNWSDGRRVSPIAHAENPFRKQHGLEGRFVVMYSGNFGVGHEFATLIGAARQLERRRPEVLFLFVGDGSRKAEAERASAGLGNVKFLPYQPLEKLGESLSAADVHAVTMLEGMEGLMVPSKLYGALASGRPVLFIGPEGCEVSRVIGKRPVGWSMRPGDAAGVAKAIESAADDSRGTVEKGERARRTFEKLYDRAVSVRTWREVLGDSSR